MKMTPHRRRPRPWRVSSEGFRELRLSCLLSRKACAQYLGVSPRTIRHWDVGRSRVPWPVVRLLRLLRQGDLGMLGAPWAGFRVERDVLVTPDGRTFTASSLRLWWSTVEQARFWRQAYDQSHAAVGRAEHPAGEARRLARFDPTAKAGNRLDEIPTSHNPRFLPVLHPTPQTDVETLVVPPRSGTSGRRRVMVVVAGSGRR